MKKSDTYIFTLGIFFLIFLSGVIYLDGKTKRSKISGCQKISKTIDEYSKCLEAIK